jgi:hypothetical protein
LAENCAPSENRAQFDGVIFRVFFIVSRIIFVLFLFSFYIIKQIEQLLLRSVIQHLGSAESTQEVQSASPYTSFVLSSLPAC